MPSSCERTWPVNATLGELAAPSIFDGKKYNVTAAVTAPIAKKVFFSMASSRDRFETHTGRSGLLLTLGSRYGQVSASAPDLRSLFSFNLALGKLVVPAGPHMIISS